MDISRLRTGCGESEPLEKRLPQPRNPISRRTDPLTSHLAAEEVTRSGRRDHQARAVLALLVQHPGSTSAELGEVGALDRYTVARRLPELERLGPVQLVEGGPTYRVTRGPSRECGVTGRMAVTWRAA